MKTAMTIAGSDSSGGAGIQADLATFTAFGVHGVSVITAITAQDSLDVSGIKALSLPMIRKQFMAVTTDFSPSAVKTGMLWSARIIRYAARLIRQNPIPLIVDPIMLSSSGVRLLRKGGIREMIRSLLPLAVLVTPNLPEAEILSDNEIHTRNDLEKAARVIHSLGTDGVLITGGHLKGEAVDTLYWHGDFYTFSAPRVAKEKIRGTGCTFSAAITAALALGEDIPAAVNHAKKYISNAISQAQYPGKGAAILHRDGKE